MPKITFEDGVTMDLEEYLEQHPKGKPLTPDGKEILDPTPIAPPVGYMRQPSLAEQVRQMVISERLRQEAEAAGMESFEDADDFDVGDDFDPSSPYEQDFDPTPIAELKRRRAAAETPPPSPPAPPQEPKPNDPPAD